jgi:hypothetical protein
MKRNILTVLIICIGILLTSCEIFQPNELSRPNATAGLNGGFEITDSGYPVNWAFGPNPETSNAFDLLIDTEHVIEGNNALKLVIMQRDRTISVRSRRIPVQIGMDYRVSLWVTNGGCSLLVNRVMTDASGKTHMRPNTIVETSASSDQWQQFEDVFSIAEDEANVFLIFLIDGPCNFWADDVKIEEVSE